MKISAAIASVILSCAAIQAGAQQGAPAKDTAMKGTTIEIIQSYNPQVKQAPKPEWTPGLPPVDTTHPVFTYFVPVEPLYYTYHAQPLRPLALGKDTLQLPYPDYIKIGVGNLSTIYADAGIGGLRTKKIESAIHLHYLSQKGSIQYQQSSLAGLEAEATLSARHNNVWHAMVNAERNQYYYYGYNHDLYQYSTDSVKQTFTSVRAGIDMAHASPNATGLSYHPAITAAYYGDQYNAAETSVNFGLPFSYSLDSVLQFRLALNGDITEYTVNGNSQSNNILQAVPGISLNAHSFTAHMYLAPTLGQNSNIYYLPDIAAAYTIPYSLFTISAGWLGTLRQNTYEELSMENPYMNNSYSVMQTRRDEVFGNIATNAGNHITISGRFSWWDYNELPLFLNNTGDQRKFSVVYDDKVNAISVKGMIRYQIAGTLSLGFNADFYNFYNSTTLHVWNEPAVKFKGDVTFHPLPALSITAYLTALEDMYTLDAQNKVVKLNSIFDIGGNAEYSIIPRLSVFLQVTNLLNDKYQRWPGYDAYGINIYGGLRFKF